MKSKSASERKAEERSRRRQEGYRPHEVWCHPKDWPVIKQLVGRLMKRRSKK